MRVFVSYGRLDRVLASQLALEIQLFGNIVWFDEQLTGGEEWWARILREIRDCQIFVFCLSPASLDSKPCQLELRYAQALRKSVMPISLVPLAQLNLPSNLQHVQAIEFLSVELLYRKALAASIRSIPLSPDLPVPLPPEPYLPLVEISEIEKRLDTEEISAGEQDAIFETLRESFSRPDGAEPARSALKKLRSYPQVTMHVALRIVSLLRLSSFAIRSDNFAALSKITTQVFDAPVVSTAFLAAEEAAFVATSSGSTWLVKNDVNDASLFYCDEKLKPARIALHPSLPALFIVGRKDMVLRSTLATRDYLGNPYEHSLGIVVALDLSSTEVVVQITDFQQESLVPGAPEGDRSFIVRMDGPTGQIASGGGAFRSLDISPNGEKLAIGGDDLYCLLWDLRWQRIVGRLRYADPDSIRSIKFHPTGQC
jgi:TIR domain